MDEHRWEVEILILNGWQMMTKYRAIIHHQEFDVLCFGCVLFVCRFIVFDVLLFNRAVLVLVMERVHSCFWLALE